MHLVEEQGAQKAFDEAKDCWPNAEMAWDAATWALLRDPEFGTPVGESGKVRAATFQGARSIGMPDVTILYDYDGDGFLLTCVDNISGNGRKTVFRMCGPDCETGK